jgi:hypothetical protein
MYDPDSHKLIFNLDKNGYDLALPEPISLYCNTAMFNLLSGFEFVTTNFRATDGTNYKLNVYNDGGLNSIDLDTYTALECYQDFASSDNWSPISSIVMCSNTLPINGTVQGQPKYYNSNTSVTSQSNNSMKIISDFSVALDANNSYRPTIDYSPTIYRLVDMMGHTPLTSIDIQLYFKDIYNNFYPMLIGSNQACNVKLLFRSKKLGV